MHFIALPVEKDYKEIIINALERGKVTQEAKNLFNVLKNNDLENITQNDKLAFFAFQEKDGSLVLTDEKLKLLKLY